MADISLYLKNFRLIISIIFLMIAWMALFGAVLFKNYWRKLLLLAIFYNCFIVFVLYQLFAREMLNDFFAIVPILFLNFIFTFATGFGIINNLIHNKEGE